jgi:hypothetical protein
MPVKRVWSWFAWTAGLLLLPAIWVALQFRDQPLPASPRSFLPRPVFDGRRLTLRTEGLRLTGELGRYQDELFAYLIFNHFRHAAELKDSEVVLTFRGSSEQRPYRLIAGFEDDVLAAAATAARLQYAEIIVPDTAGFATDAIFAAYRDQTRLFDAAYNLPVKRKLQQLPKEQLARYLRPYIRFKSATDPRIRRQIEPVPQALSTAQATQLTADIITIAEFFELPLDFFLGIGAMENNYMNVRGDLTNSTWKRRAQPDDIVLERKRGRVRVLNDSAGVWQITRETLRYVHGLYKRDTRDYKMLPVHLQPPDELKINDVDPHVLTTYAGLLFRDLLDRFDGNIATAVGAYNGGPGRPNMKYGEGVQAVATHARTVLERAAALNGASVMETTWLRAR